jgi:hypothetical protein
MSDHPFVNEDYTEEREVLNTQSMLESGFLSELKKTKLGKKIDVPAAAEAQEDAPQVVATNANRERLLTDLYDVRDSLLTSFASVNHNSPMAHVLTENINKLGSCIEELGGPVDPFDPLDHLSGLESPDLEKNADRVIATTRECYKIGSIEDACIKDSGRTIVITFSGKDEGNDASYKAMGTITASRTWIGNEAIDYIYTPSEGKMSVKALNENGQWEDHSDHYRISWELEEEIGGGNSEESVEKNTVNKEEVTEASQNKEASKNTDGDDDFPITVES